jgi:pyruvate/2-oxoacid:ferredoxin oxidoreductase alpha subunit
MSKVQILTGNSAAAAAVMLCDVQVVAAYPITPQSQLAEMMSQYIESGELKAEYVRVEGEHTALTVCISASTVGARVFTATSANGLLYMHEQLHWAAGARLPIVMCCVNRGVGAPWTIFNDQQDSLAQRDTGWIQLYCRNNQEILDTVIQAYRIAESVYVPVMVCFDGFVLSHTMMPVEIPDQQSVREYLPPYRPHTILTPDDPRCLNPVLFPNRRADTEGILRDGYMEMRYKLEAALEESLAAIGEANDDFARRFGRDHGGLVWGYRTEDAELHLVAMGSLASEATVAADSLRSRGIRAGVTGVRAFRPFPKLAVRKALQGAKAAVVFEKSISYGNEGALCTEIKGALYGTGIEPAVYNYIAGLGGRDVKSRELEAAAGESWDDFQADRREKQTTWLNCVTG